MPAGNHGSCVHHLVPDIIIIIIVIIIIIIIIIIIMGFAVAFPRGGSSSTVSRSNWNLEVLVLVPDIAFMTTATMILCRSVITSFLP